MADFPGNIAVVCLVFLIALFMPYIYIYICFVCVCCFDNRSARRFLLCILQRSGMNCVFSAMLVPGCCCDGQMV